METFEITKNILKILSSERECDVLELKNKINLTDPILPYLLWLEEMNFVKRKSISDKFKLIFSKTAAKTIKNIGFVEMLDF